MKLKNRARREETIENVQQNAFNTPIAPTQLPNVSNRKEIKSNLSHYEVFIKFKLFQQ
jgi:hypothetical protein